MERPNVLINNYGTNMRQRHLRNLRSILIRNICPRYSIQSIEELCRYSFFFTLHKSHKCSAYYTSTKATGTLNPVWEKINFTKDVDKHILPTDLKNESICIRVWLNRDVGDDDDDDRECGEQVMVTWSVHFPSLILLENEQHLIFGHNVILFQFDDGLYTAPFADKVIMPTKTTEEYVNTQNSRTSYRLNSLKRLQLTLRAISEVKKKSDAIKLAIMDIHDRRKAIEGQKESIERTRCRIKAKKMELEARERYLRHTQSLSDSQHSMNEIDDLALKAKYDQTSNSWEFLHKNKKNYFDVRDRLIQTGSHLVKRRKQLLTDMASIYPITKDSCGKHHISGVHLPNSEDLSGHDDTMLGVALGFTCHLVKLISVFLDVPLRYPIDHKGSRSTIRDDIIDVLNDKERDFPLYSKGRERYQFEYAVYILNKNIVQLRHYCGMSTSGLGSTLFNLHTLLDDKLGVVKSTRGNAFTSQHVPIIPSFGDASGSSMNSFTSSSFGISMASTSSSSRAAPSSFDPKLSYRNVITGSFVSDAFGGSGSDITQLSSSFPMTTAGESPSRIAAPINISVARLVDTRSLSPSIESLTSSRGGGGFLRRRLRAFKLLKASSANSSPGLSKCNSKCQLVEKPERREISGEDATMSGDGNDARRNEGTAAAGQLVALEHSSSEVVRTDATLNEVASKLDDILKASENQNIPDELCWQTEPGRSEDGVTNDDQYNQCIIADDQNQQNVNSHSLNGNGIDSDRDANCNGVGDDHNATGECSGNVEHLPDQSKSDTSSTPASRNQMVDANETLDDCLSSDDEIIQ